MKLTSYFICAALVAAGAGATHGQQALKTDTAGNPVTPLNLSGSNITGTLPSSRLPAGVAAPIVQTISVGHGTLTLAPGASVVVLSTLVDGPLTLVLPSIDASSKGRTLVVVDPLGYSASSSPVAVRPALGVMLDGDSEPVAALAGAGAMTFVAADTDRWISDGCERPFHKGQPSGYPGLDGSGNLDLPGTSYLINGSLVANGVGLYVADQQVAGVCGDLYAQGAQWFDGFGNVSLTSLYGSGQLFSGDHLDAPVISTAGELTSFGCFTLLPVNPSSVATPSSGVVHFVSSVDGKEYVRDAAGHTHALW